MKRIILVVIFVCLNQAVLADIVTNTFIINSAPSIEDITTYRFYFAYDDKIEETDFGICRNQDAKSIYFELNVTDLNGMEEISKFGNITYTVMSNDTLDRFTPPRNLSQLFLSETNGYFIQGFSMIRNDSSYNYSIVSRIHDGTELITHEKNYTFFLDDCVSYINDSLSTVADKGILVNASPLNVTVEMFADYDSNGSMHLYLRPNISINYSSDLILVSDYLNVTTSKDIIDVVTLNEIHIHYSDDTVEALEVNEMSLEINRWNGSAWNPVDGGLDSYLNYAYGIEEDLGVYAIFGIHMDSPRCIDTWKCGTWSDCNKKGKQSRKCKKTNSCRSKKNKPSTKKECVYRGGKYKPPKKVEAPKTTVPVPADREDIILDNSREILFDINVEMLDGEMVTSDEMLLKIGLLNFGLPGLVHVNLSYEIVSGDDVYYRSVEIVPVETQVEFLRTINVSDIPDGHYTLILDLNYKGQLEPAKAQKDFVIRRDESLNVYPILIAIFAVIILLLVFDKDTRRKIRLYIKK